MNNDINYLNPAGLTIERIHQHLIDGNEVATIGYYGCTVYDVRHLSWFRAEGANFRIGPVGKSKFAWGNCIKLVPSGMTMKRARKSAKARKLIL